MSQVERSLFSCTACHIHIKLRGTETFCTTYLAKIKMYFLLQELGNIITELIMQSVYTHSSERGILLISQARFIDNDDFMFILIIYAKEFQ